MPHPDALWQGSELEITHSFRDERVVHEHVTTPYTKKKDRWSPRYENRPRRDVFYIGIDKCVPLIESEKRQVKVNYSTIQKTDDGVEWVLKKASHVLNKRYSTLNNNVDSKGKQFIGVVADGLTYSALSMSAGEQKVFHILDVLYKAPKNSLILIDEIDLLLHDSALRRLIEIISERAEEKNIQVVFTTHRETVVGLGGIINIRHIVTKAGKSLCFEETKPDAINRLTGVQVKPIEIFVEDDLAAAVVMEVALQLGMQRHVNIQLYGAALNCFTLACGLVLGGESCEDALFVLDGDVYRERDGHEEIAKKLISGDDPEAGRKRRVALGKIAMFDLPSGIKPEEFLHSCIVDIGGDLSCQDEISMLASEISFAADAHGYISGLIDRLGLPRSVGLSKVVGLISRTAHWDGYVAPVRDWLISKRVAVCESHKELVAEI
ncbi:AAA domain, putative AbiEii toxin, Type IV TA system [compost metagenome]